MKRILATFATFLLICATPLLAAPGETFETITAEGVRLLGGYGSSCDPELGQVSFFDNALLAQPPVVQTSHGSCSASRNCGDGNTISCTGHSSCTNAGQDCSVTCDGQKTFCPNKCTVSRACSGGCGVTCTSCSGNCQVGSNYVSCDGNTWDCSLCDFDPPSP